MQINRVCLRNFRNFTDLDLHPGGGVNIIWGDNGQGKTNLLEGIYLFAYFKSFRGAANNDLVGTKGEEGRVTLETHRAGMQHKLDLQVTTNSRIFLLDGKKPRPMESLLEAIRAILFAPDELQVLRSQPAARRALLDRAIFQLDPAHLSRSVEFERVLKQRNHLLRERPHPTVLRPWNEALIRCGAVLRQARFEFCERFATSFAQVHRQLSNDGNEAVLRYSVSSGSRQVLEEELAAELHAVATRELQLGQSCAGPQRDDPVFLLGEHPVKHFASQGQWRTMVLSFKLALHRLLQEELGTPPVLLFDDFAAELDRERLGRLFDLLAGSGTQVFLTTADPGRLLTPVGGDITTFHMTAGRVTPASCID